MKTQSAPETGTPPDEARSRPPGETASAVKPKTDHWNTPVHGHGIAYMREMIVEFRTLQWINPHAASALAARKKARDKATLLAQAREALKRPSASDTPPADTLKKLVLEAEAVALVAEEEAALLERRQAVAEAAHIEARNLAAAIVARQERGTATWIDMLEFESALLRLLSGEKLRARYTSLAAEYKGLTGADAPAMPSDEPVLRAQADTLQDELHWLYTTLPIQEKQRARLTISLIVVTAVVALVVIKMFSGVVLGWVALAGALGAALSAFQRVQSCDLRADAMTNCEKDYDGRPWWRRPVGWFWSNVCSHNSFALAPAIGALSALVLAHIFAAKLLTGTAFPSTKEESVKPSAVADLGGNPTPKTSTPSKLADTNAVNPIVANKPAPKNPAPTPAPAMADSGKPANGSAGGPGDPASPPHQPAGGGDSTKTSGAKDSEPDGRGNCWERVGCSQLALLLVWAFLAGFSERLVPDILTRFAQKTKT